VQNIELTFASGESSLAVRSFSVEQRMSGLFEIAAVAVSPDDDLDLAALLGGGAVFRMGSTDAGGVFRAFTGVVSHAEQVEIDAAGHATYLLRIVPALWRTTRRRNNRIFQHRSLPEIAVAVLAEWGIDPVLELDAASFPKLEYRVQYAETDFAFLSRILEEAGIAYCFRDPPPGSAGQVDAQTALVLAADAHRNEPRDGGPLVHVLDKEVRTSRDAIWQVRFMEDVRSGRLTIRDYDFRSRPDFQLIAEARAAVGLEERFELYDYAPGAFLVEPEPGRPARVDERFAKALAARQLGAGRHGKRAIAYRASALDLAPGCVFQITGHPRRELAADAHLLVVRQTIAGELHGTWSITGEAVLASDPYRPPCVTPKPRVHGLQSAIVVGPPGEEIHTDEHGRVRVQFHWDREGARDEKSSCFLRVSQGWASRGYGGLSIPRVGDEVLVGFFEGDPDQPVVVGRVHNSAARVPYDLPVNKTRSTWRSESTPGGGGHNEIMFEDQKGKELFHVHAERDLERIVKQCETATIGASLKTTVGADETRDVAADLTLKVGGSRSSRVEKSESISVGESFTLDLGGGTGASVSKDKRIVLTTGEASIVLDGPNIYFDAQAAVALSGGQVVAIAGAEVHVDGGPNVYLNASSATPPGPSALAASAALSVTAAALQETPEERSFKALLTTPPEAPGAAPEAVLLPAHIESQLQAARDKVLSTVDQIETEVKDKVDLVKDKIQKFGEDLVARVEKARAEAYARIDALRAQAEKLKAEAAAQINALKAKVQAFEAEVEARIKMAEQAVQQAIARVKQAIQQIKDRINEIKQEALKLVADVKQRIADLKAQVKAQFDALRKQAIQVRNEAEAIVNQVKADIEHAKEQVKQLVADVKQGIETAKQHVKNIIADLTNSHESLRQRLEDAYGEAKGLVSDAKADAGKVANDAKGIVNDAKNEAQQLKQQVSQTVNDAKSLANNAVNDAKQDVASAKSAVSQSVNEAKQVAADAKAQAQGALNDAKSAASDVKNDAKGVVDGLMGHKSAAQSGAQQAAGAVTPFSRHVGAAAGAPASASAAASGASSSASSAASSSAAPPVSPLPSSSIVTKPGALGGASVARAINGNQGATFLQSPNEGQLMVLRTQGAAPLAPEQLTSGVVEHQMSGLSSSDAFAAALRDHGYVVYERPWESASGAFLQKAIL
jgi:type VI secretion system secreted protein VgrG